MKPCSSAEDALHYDVQFLDCCRVQVIGLHYLRQPGSIDVLYLDVAKNRLDVVLVLPLVGVDRAFFQLLRSVVCEIPICKLGKTHIFVQLRVTFAVSIELESVLLGELFGFLWCHSVGRSVGC